MKEKLLVEHLSVWQVCFVNKYADKSKSDSDWHW